MFSKKGHDFVSRPIPDLISNGQTDPFKNIYLKSKAKLHNTYIFYR